MEYLRKNYDVSLGRACRLMNLSRLVYYYQSHRDDHAVMEKRHALAEKRPTEGFWKIYFRIRREVCNGIKFRVFNLLDDFNREALAIEVDTSLIRQKKPGCYVTKRGEESLICFLLFDRKEV